MHFPLRRSPKAVAMVTSTIRNPETYQYFIKTTSKSHDLCVGVVLLHAPPPYTEKAGLTCSVVDLSNAVKHFYYDHSQTIELLELSLHA